MTATPARQKALGTVPDGMTKDEWQMRVDLAACYQLTAKYGWSHMTGTHISARIPNTDDHFLLNPYGMFFEEITASSLIKVDKHGNILGGADYPINPAGFIIHSAVHMSMPNILCVMHTHTPAGTAVSCLDEGLLPLSQNALTILDFVGYHDYEGPALREDERDRIVDDIGDGRIAILRNHGLLTIGETVGEAFTWMWRAEMACKMQLEAQASGAKLRFASKEAQDYTRAQGRRIYSRDGFAKPGHEWPALLRQLERAGSNYYT